MTLDSVRVPRYMDTETKNPLAQTVIRVYDVPLLKRIFRCTIMLDEKGVLLTSKRVIREKQLRSRILKKRKFLFLFLPWRFSTY